VKWFILRLFSSPTAEDVATAERFIIAIREAISAATKPFQAQESLIQVRWSPFIFSIYSQSDRAVWWSYIYPSSHVFIFHPIRSL
jgi:hypothetical protein